MLKYFEEETVVDLILTKKIKITLNLKDSKSANPLKMLLFIGKFPVSPIFTFFLTGQ
jgi:hypothetical protein